MIKWPKNQSSQSEFFDLKLKNNIIELIAKKDINENKIQISGLKFFVNTNNPLELKLNAKFNKKNSYPVNYKGQYLKLGKLYADYYEIEITNTISTFWATSFTADCLLVVA